MKNFSPAHIATLTQIMKLAHQIRKEQNVSKSEAMKTAHACYKIENKMNKVDLNALKKALQNGSVLIQAKKTDKKKGGKTIIGEYTEREATLDFTNYQHLKNALVGSGSHPDTFNFISITDGGAWRAFRKDHILGFKIL